MKQKGFRRIYKTPSATNILNLLEKVQRDKGFGAEERFFRALQNSDGNAPCWFKGISKATKKEDGKGIDFIVHSAFGNIFIQIKSSRFGAKKFLEKRKGKNFSFRVVVLIIKSGLKEEEIRNISFPAIQAEIDSFRKSSCF